MSRDLQALIAQQCLASSCLTANLTETVRLTNTFSSRIRVQRHHRENQPSRKQLASMRHILLLRIPTSRAPGIPSALARAVPLTCKGWAGLVNHPRQIMLSALSFCYPLISVLLWALLTLITSINASVCNIGHRIWLHVTLQFTLKKKEEI